MAALTVLSALCAALCQRHRALLIYVSTIITSRRGQFAVLLYYQQCDSPVVGRLCLQMTVHSATCSYGCPDLKKFRPLSSHNSCFIYWSVEVLRSVIRTYKSCTLHTPSVAQAPLASIYRATYAVQQSPQNLSSAVWVLLFN